jgi:hypothetical protein
MSTSRSKRVLWILISIDAALIALHAARYAFPSLHVWYLSVQEDHSLAEWWQYVKEAAIAVAMLRVAMLKHNRAYLAWAILFAYLLLDDSMRLHDQAGAALGLAMHFEGIFGLRPQELGELIFLGLMGPLIIAMIAAAYFDRRCADDEFRQVSRWMIGMMIVLLFFGVALDMLHEMVSFWVPLRKLVGGMEDGGEMVVMSLICWYVLGLVAKARDAASTATTTAWPQPSATFSSSSAVVKT